MKVIIAIDSFKGSLTSIEAGEATREGILQVHPSYFAISHYRTCILCIFSCHFPAKQKKIPQTCGLRYLFL